MKDNIERRLIGLFVAMLAVLAWVNYSAVHTINQSIRSNDWVNHTHAVILDAADILSYLHAGDSAVRSFVITGHARDQAAYRDDYSTMVERLNDALALTRSAPEEAGVHARLVDLQNLISNRVDVARSIVKAHKEGGIHAVQSLFVSSPDVESVTMIARSIQGLIGNEQDLLQKRDQTQHLQAQATKTVVYAGVGVNFALLVVMLWLIRDDLISRRKAAKALEDANAQLEAKVQERTAELVKTNQALKQENLERRWSYQALDHQMRYNQLIINSIGELVFVISRALNISRINPAVVHQTSWEPQDLVAQSLERVLQLGTDGASQGQNPISLAMRDGREIQERQATLLTRSGQSLSVRFNLVPLHDQDKVVGGVVTVRIPDNVRQTST